MSGPGTGPATCLWFRDGAEEAAEHYLRVVPGGRRLGVLEAEGGGPPVAVWFELQGMRFIALNGNPEPGFGLSVSVVLTCRSQEEIDRLWDGLGEGGRTHACGWLQDRYGVAWQIVPEGLEAMVTDPDPTRRARVMAALQGMIKLDKKALEAAHAG